MGIEKDINNKEFKSEWHKLRVNLLYSSTWLSNGIQEFLKPFGLTQKQFNVLQIVRNHKGDLPLTVLEIRDLMTDKMSDASRLINRMYEKGIIRKYPCTMDKRATRVEMTKKGRLLLKKVEKNFDILDGLVKSLSKKEAKTLNGLLDKMRKD